jgi:transposase
VLLLDSIIYNSGCYYLIDKAYVDFKRLYKIELSKAFFVTRAKENMAYVVTIQNNIEGQAGVSKDELVTLQRWHTRKKYPVAIRRIEYHDTLTDLHFVFITNNMLLDATVIARLYKERWRVELFFKWIKQNLRIKKFYGTSENAVKTQIWIAVCDYLLIAILKKQLKTPLSLNQILQVLSVSLFEKCSIKDLLQKQQQTKHVSKQYELF